MADVNKDSNHSTEGGADRPLPWVARFILFVLILLLAAFMIGLPVWSVQRYGATTEIDLWGPVLATLLGLTTMTVSGIFMFMTFRIDRGTKLKAEWTAKKTAEKAVREVIDKVVGKQIAVVAVAQEMIRNELAAATRKVVEIEDDLAQAKSDIDGQLQGAADTMRTMADKVASAETELSGQFDALQETMRDQFAKAAKQMEDANIDELIRKYVEIHMANDEGDDGGNDDTGNGGENSEGGRKEE